MKQKLKARRANGYTMPKHSVSLVMQSSLPLGTRLRTDYSRTCRHWLKIIEAGYNLVTAHYGKPDSTHNGTINKDEEDLFV